MAERSRDQGYRESLQNWVIKNKQNPDRQVQMACELIAKLLLIPDSDIFLDRARTEFVELLDLRKSDPFRKENRTPLDDLRAIICDISYELGY